MKQIIFILFSILALNTNIHAQTKATTNTLQAPVTQPTKVEVATPDLPDIIVQKSKYLSFSTNYFFPKAKRLS